MFHYDRGLKLTRADLAVDFRRRQPRAFVSHAHADHMARHEYALCTPATSRFYQHRLGKRRVLEIPFGKPTEWGGLQLATYPSGHCLGSAMLWADDGQCSLLYTGDFKLAPSATAEPAEVPQADILVTESTFGDPRFRTPDRECVVAELIAVVREALDEHRPPVIQAYALGKAQEVTRLLTAAGIPVLQPREIWEISLIYQQLGVELGDFQRWPGYWKPGHAVIVPPSFHKQRGERLRFKNPLRIAVTGWGALEQTGRRWGADRVIALSDHAHYDELLELIDRVDPQVVYCTHGPAAFVDRLRERGIEAHRLEDARGEQLQICSRRGPAAPAALLG